MDFKKILGYAGRTIRCCVMAGYGAILLDDMYQRLNSRCYKDASTSTLYIQYLLVGAVHEQHRLGGVIKGSSIPPIIPAGRVRIHVHQYRWTRRASI